MPHARWSLLSYVLLALADEAKALLQGQHITDHLHHVASAGGFGCDLVFGSDRTHALAVIMLSSEAVGPFYTLYEWSRGQSGYVVPGAATAAATVAVGGFPSRLHILAARVAIVCAVATTLLIRLPLAVSAAFMVVSDCLRKAGWTAAPAQGRGAWTPASPARRRG